MRKNHFFYLPRNDRRIFTIALIVGAAVGGVMMMFDNDGNIEEKDNLNNTISDGRQLQTADNSSVDFRYDEPNDRLIELFPFDPNTADSVQLLRLGLSKWQVRNIYRYRNKGGIFRNKADFSGLYGLTEKQYRELEPYINISPDYKQAKRRYAEYMPEAAPRDTFHYQKKLKAGQTIAINESDTAALKEVPGIGSGYARAIINYRERLGGFVSVNQLMEIRGITDNMLDYFHIDHRPVRQLNVNRLSVNQLRKHPYLSFTQAKAIVDYRRLKGRINSIEDLRLIKEFSANDIIRLQPYLSF